jgi:hypothetical protein
MVPMMRTLTHTCTPILMYSTTPLSDERDGRTQMSREDVRNGFWDTTMPPLSGGSCRTGPYWYGITRPVAPHGAHYITLLSFCDLSDEEFVSRRKTTIRDM